MPQNAAEVPVHNTQRRAAIAKAGVHDHAGAVHVAPMERFDLDRTIFNTLEGTIPRMVMQSRIAKEPMWSERALRAIDDAYVARQADVALPQVDPELLRFLQQDCDFDVEHADGSFLDHLYFCYEYGTHHYPEHSPLVLLLHSILGTGTNTFAMEAGKIPTLRALMSDFEWIHVEAFPSMLRLLYGLELRRELRAHLDRLDLLEGIRLYRVIDNAELTMGVDDLWIQLNYQLIHLIDFLPVSNWQVHANDTAFIVFRDLYDLLGLAGRRHARLHYTPPGSGRERRDEELTWVGWLASFIPVSVSEMMAAKSVHQFSDRIGHSMRYELLWR